MKRELTAREKGLLLFLAILVIALGYFKLIFEPIDQQVKDYRANTEQEQTLLDTELVRLAQMNKMKETVERIRATAASSSGSWTAPWPPPTIISWISPPRRAGTAISSSAPFP